MTECRDYQELICQMLDGELSEPQKTELAAHIGVCAECRRVFNAFAFISASIDEGMVQPPEGLRGDVMASIRAGKAAQAPAGKRRLRPGSLAALAACMAIVIFAASKTPLFSPGRLAAQTAVDSAQADQESAPAEPEAALFEDSDLSPQDTPDAGGGELRDAPPEGGGAVQNAETTAQPTQEPKLGLAAQYSAGPSLVEVFSGESADKEPAARKPLAAMSDAESIALIMDMLAFSQAGDGISVSGTPTFIVEVTQDAGSYTLSVWIADGRLCCQSSADGKLYVAAGDISDLLALVAAA